MVLCNQGYLIKKAVPVLRPVFELKGEIVRGKEVPYYRWYLPLG